VDLAVGLAPHTGWAIAVVVGGDVQAPQVLHRERVELVPHGVERFAYHLVQDWPVAKAERHLAETEVAVERTAKQVVADLADRAAEHGRLVGVGVVGQPHELPDDLAAILAKHMLLHAGEGELYLSALLDAAAAAGLAVTLAPPKKTVGQVGGLIGSAPGLLVERLGALRKELGAPWTADHKAATAAALLALASR
jgi:hypothetical protein